MRSLLGSWARAHVEQLLTVLSLPLVLITAAPTGHVPNGWGYALAGLTWVPLIARTRWPVPVAVVVVALDAVHIATASHVGLDKGTFPAATMLALYTVGARCRAGVAWPAGAVAAVAQYVTALIAISSHPSEDLLYLNWAMVGTLIGRLVRERQARIATAEARAAQAEASKAAEASRQVTEERMRIARELHDVLAHHITVVNAQAGVAQYLLRTDPDSAEQALAGIADNTRAALDELRATLGLLRSDTDEDDQLSTRTPAPGADRLPALIETFVEGGADVHVRVDGSPYALSVSGDLALYRIAQEALTNASKHAPGSVIEVALSWTEASVTLVVTNASPAAGAVTGDGTGHGLIGMRERAVAADGELSAGPTADGGYRVHVQLPRPITASEHPAVTA